MGFDVHQSRTAIVETQKPGRRPFEKVLAQNAWTVLPADDYKRLSHPYPPAWKARMAARRAVARFNMHRADEVVCLTQSMGDLVQSMTTTPIRVAPVLAPMDIWEKDETDVPLPQGYGPNAVLVPGTVTWYKRPQLAPQVALNLGQSAGRLPTILYAGHDDGTGAWAATKHEAARLGLQVTRAPLSRTQMIAALRSSLATIVPSELESLSLSLSEALILSQRVIASSLSVHREISEALGREPEWLGTQLPGNTLSPTSTTVTVRKAKEAWRDVGRALELPERIAEGRIP